MSVVAPTRKAVVHTIAQALEKESERKCPLIDDLTQAVNDAVEYLGSRFERTIKRVKDAHPAAAIVLTEKEAKKLWKVAPIVQALVNAGACAKSEGWWDLDEEVSEYVPAELYQLYCELEGALELPTEFYLDWEFYISPADPEVDGIYGYDSDA
jgi:hypothetical protein